MDKMRMESLDMTAQNIEKIGALFPNCITEALDENGKLKKAINFDLLKQMLSDDVVEGSEAYEFTWVGKKASIVEAGRPIRKTLRPCKAESINWDTTENLYIEGDNLDVLKLLQESYLGAIKMIYIDPPYNTGNDFIYRDDFKQGVDEYEEDLGVLDEEGIRLFRNTDSNGRFHSDWCSMMCSRLLLAWNLLSDDGFIFISIDDNELASLIKICDEVFGRSNFVGQFIWTRKKKGSFLNRKIRKMTEYILCYQKKDNEWKFFGEEAYKNKLQPIVKRTNAVKRLEIPGNTVSTKLKDGIYKNGKYNDGPTAINFLKNFYVENGVVTSNLLLEGRFVWTQDFLDKELMLGTTVELSNQYGFNVGRHDQKEKFKIPSSIIDHQVKVGTNEDGSEEVASIFGKGQGEIFDYPKPSSLMKYLIRMVTYDSQQDIVLDFFSGSATTAHAVMQLNAEDGGNRKFIMVQLPEETDEKSEAFKAGYRTIADIGKERIRRAGQKIKDESPLTTLNLDVGFRVFKLDDTNMKDVYYSADEYSQNLITMMESNIKPDRTDLDLLFGCLLEWGLPLSLPHTFEIIEGCTVHTYNEGDLVACFDENIPESVIKTIAKKKPLRAVFRDSSFASSSSKINVTEVFKLLAPDTRVRVI